MFVCFMCSFFPYSCKINNPQKKIAISVVISGFIFSLYFQTMCFILLQASDDKLYIVKKSPGEVILLPYNPH